MTDWTRDADGNYVDWTKPPYYVNSVVNLVLPGEDLVPADELSRRRAEYMKLARRELRRNKKSP